MSEPPNISQYSLDITKLVLDIATPVIVAKKLRQLADAWDNGHPVTRAQLRAEANELDEVTAATVQAYETLTRTILARAQELDPEGGLYG